MPGSGVINAPACCQSKSHWSRRRFLQNGGMAKPKRKRTPKIVLRLPDLEHSKTEVLNSLTSPSSRRSYDHAMREFTDWYRSEPRLAFNKTVVTVHPVNLIGTGPDTDQPWQGSEN